jgi:hypothetical protein
MDKIDLKGLATKETGVHSAGDGVRGRCGARLVDGGTGERLKYEGRLPDFVEILPVFWF